MKTIEKIKYDIYLDLDGVVFDFMKKANEITGLTETEINTSKDAKRQFWKHINAHVKSGKKFFEDLELFDDAQELWDYVAKHDHVVCTAIGNIPNAGIEKRNAVRKHFGHEAANKAHLVRHSEDKAQFATPTSILIDDRTKSINPWVAAGGIGILHVSAADTIRQLKELGVE